MIYFSNEKHPDFFDGMHEVYGMIQDYLDDRDYELEHDPSDFCSLYDVEYEELLEPEGIAKVEKVLHSTMRDFESWLKNGGMDNWKQQFRRGYYR